MDSVQFPLSAGTYVINGRKYRRTAYQIKAATDDVTPKFEQFEDTPDVYDDEPSAGCLAPPGLPALKKKIAKAKEVKEAKPESNSTQPTEDERISVIDGKKWIASISVPACFIGKLHGMNRRALNALENDTQCRVKTPRRDENKPCEISSIVRLECVQRCLDRIEIFVDDAKKTARVTHFVALPCDQHEVQENFEVFKQLVLDSEHFDASCKNPQLFTKSPRLHLTLSVVCLFDDVDLQRITESFKVIEEEIKEIMNNKPMIADIQGIDMMNDDPSQVSVIYAKVSGEKIQEVANHLNRRLIELGFAKNEGGDEVKLHMTLMNARYVAQAEKLKKFTFDAKKILEDLKESYFGTFQLTEICLCPLNSNSSSDKFYDKLAVMRLA
ncbi:Protein CBG06998 [Caenorhabditis briggsae]|uniref:Protein CBG06998 n=1 Tax=Caenorhabditis briggsae TaxID=6238 RepID=A8X3Y6_CAEBR|nr:Protein CBG06998 [Caenorhabditis briggsae]CAP27346.2 Protein CBG06998 [Caenorhabditis briggsae]